MEHIKGWLAAAKRGGVAEEKGKEKTEAEEEEEYLWGKVVEITQTTFRDGKLAEEAAWQAAVLIPKGKGEFRGIGLVEVTWKLLTVILHRRLTTGINSMLCFTGSGRVAVPGRPPSRPSCSNSLQL